MQEKNPSESKVDPPQSSPPNRHEVDFKANLRKVKKANNNGNNPELKRETSDLTHNATTVDFKVKFLQIFRVDHMCSSDFRSSRQP